MTFRKRERDEKTYFILSTCALTFFLIYLFTFGCGKNTDLSQAVSSKSKTPYDADCSKYRSPDHDGSNLQPPSQEWAHCQFYKAMSFLGWEYAPPNHWENCTARTYYFKKIDTIFTGIPKTGCSNWLIALLRAEGELNKTVDPTKLRWVHGGISGRHRIKHFFEQYDNSIVQNAFSFAVVRNPWTRMVSGYRQKLSSEDTQGGEFRGFGKKIVRIIRGIRDQEKLEDLYPTFEEFVKYLIKVEGHVDRHFAPQTKELCIPHAMYDFIVPLEYSATLSQEVWNKINSTGPSLLGSYDKASDPRLQSSALYAKKWLSEMDPELIEQVYEIYRGDFILMNYSNFTHPDFPLPLHVTPALVFSFII